MVLGHAFNVHVYLQSKESMYFINNLNETNGHFTTVGEGIRTLK